MTLLFILQNEPLGISQNRIKTLPYWISREKIWATALTGSICRHISQIRWINTSAILYQSVVQTQYVYKIWLAHSFICRNHCHICKKLKLLSTVQTGNVAMWISFASYLFYQIAVCLEPLWTGITEMNVDSTSSSLQGDNRTLLPRLHFHVD